MTTMISFGNDWTVFFTRPVSGALMAIGILTLLYPAWTRWRASRRAAAR
jgi:putative tricarboxylic transport membrane protein